MGLREEHRAQYFSGHPLGVYLHSSKAWDSSLLGVRVGVATASWLHLGRFYLQISAVPEPTICAQALLLCSLTAWTFHLHVQGRQGTLSSLTAAIQCDQESPAMGRGGWCFWVSLGVDKNSERRWAGFQY